MLGVFAEFERSMIRERVMAGLKRARANGKTLGRPKVDEDTEKAIRAALRAGMGMHAARRKHGVGMSTVQRIRAEMAGNA
jgi:DNA invertase Pin-like site-specific DNA recombinase